MNFYIWLIAFVILLIIEILTLGLTTIWFAVGALGAFITALFTTSLWIQLTVFLVLSLFVLLFYRPIAIKYINSRRIKTNIDELIGKEGKVTEKIDNLNQTGRILLDGKDWSARATFINGKIDVDTVVKVVEIKGVKCIVEPVIMTKELA